MSAFVVSKQHIDALVSVAIHGPSDSASQWREFSWARSCEEYEPNPQWAPGYTTDTRWVKLATAGLSELAKTENEVTADEFGFILWAENVASVRYRYPGEDIDTLPGTYAEDGRHEVSHGYSYSPSRRTRPTTVEAFKLLNCLDYQSCEHPEWRESEAFAILAALKDALVYCLPGYSEAAWERSETPR